MSLVGRSDSFDTLYGTDAEMPRGGSPANCAPPYFRAVGAIRTPHHVNIYLFRAKAATRERLIIRQAHRLSK